MSATNKQSQTNNAILKDIILQKHSEGKILYENIKKIAEQILQYVEKFSDHDVKNINSRINFMSENLKKSNKDYIDKTFLQTFGLETIMNIFISFDDIYNTAFELLDIFSNTSILKKATEGKSDSFIHDLNYLFEMSNNIIDDWILVYREAALMVNNIIDVDDDFKKVLINSPKNELFVQLAKLTADHFKGSERNRLLRKVEEWKDITINVELGKTTKLEYNKVHTVPLDYQYGSRFGLVPTGPFRKIHDVFKEHSQTYNAEESICDNFTAFTKPFILFYDPQKSIIQYNILPLIDPQYIQKNNLHTERDAPLTDKVLERFMNIKKITIDNNNHGSDGHDNKIKKQIQPHMMYMVHDDPDSKVYVFEYQGGDILLELSQNPQFNYITLSSAAFILNNGRMIRMQQYNSLLENQIIKNNQLGKVKGLRIDFESEIQVSLDIIAEKIQKEVSLKLGQYLNSKSNLPKNKYDFLNLLSSKEDPYVIDYIILNSLEYTKSDSKDIAEANISYLAVMKDIIHNFKREMRTILKNISVPQSYFDKSSSGTDGEFKEFIIESYLKVIENTVYSLQKSQSMWDDVTKSLKNYISTHRQIDNVN